jgi:hypothetical protein
MLEVITVLANAGKLHDIGVRAGIKPVLQELDDACLDSPAVRYCYTNVSETVAHTTIMNCCITHASLLQLSFRRVTVK